MLWGDNERKADRLYQKGELERAAEVYRRAKCLTRAAQVYAELGKIEEAVELYEEEGEWLSAAELLQSQGRAKEAISRFEKARAFHKAARAALEARNHSRASRLFEKAGMFRKAAESYLELGEIDKAERALGLESKRLQKQREESGDAVIDREIRQTDLQRAEILVKLRHPLKAAELLLRHRELTRAAPLFQKAGRFAEAAAAFLEIGHLDYALAAIEKAPEAADELRAEIFQACGRHAKAAEAFERMGQIDSAASSWEAAGEWKKAAEHWEQVGEPDKAAEFYLRVDQPRDAARCYFASGQYKVAAELFEQLPDARRAAESWEKAEEPLKAGEAYFETGDEITARRLLETIPESDTKNYDRASMLLAPLLLEAGETEAAHERLTLVKKRGGSLPKLDLLYCHGRIAEASGRWDDAEGFYEQILGIDARFRDTADRKRDLRRKRHDKSGQSTGSLTTQPAESAPIPDTRATETPQRNTAPISLDASLRQTTRSRRQLTDSSTQPFTIGLEDEPPAAQPTKVGVDSAALRLSLSGAFDLGAPIDPWWSGAEFFEARHRETSRDVLLVIFPAAALGDRAVLLRQTARRLTTLEDSAILHLQEIVGLGDDSLVLVYERFANRTLQGALADRSLSFARRLSLVVQLCQALVAAHRLGITHQWISPRTVLIDDQHKLKLVGLGLNDVLGFGDDTSQIYLSPEVRAGNPVGPATDMFALGLLAATLFQTQLPTGWEQAEFIDPKNVTWPQEAETVLGSYLRDLLLRCLHKNPSRRPSAESLLNKLSAQGLVPGQILNDRYEIRGELGAGGMGRVYRARDLELDDDVAIKTVISSTGGRAEDEERLLREVQICRKLTHTNVVRVYDLGRFPGGIFVTMELLEGEGLDKVIERQAPLDLARVKRILIEIAAALAVAHRLHVIHRDLKPGNVMLLEDDQVKVLDFGIARQVGNNAGNLTATGQVIGSPLYMAPEQIQGKELDPTCDLYALGVMAFALLTGREPFLGDSPTEIVLQHLKNPPPQAGELREGGLPAEWNQLLGRLLAKKPGERISSAVRLGELLQALPEG